MLRQHIRIPHIMKKHKTNSHPSNFLFFDTETKDSFKGKGKKVERHKFWFGWMLAFRYEQQRVTRVAKERFDDVDDFYRWIETRLDKKRPLYVVAHNLGFDLTILDFWNKSEEHNWDCTYAVLEDPPLFMSYIVNGCRLIFIDTFNFWKCGVADMGRSLGIEKLPMPALTAPKTSWDTYCLRDVEILANQVTNLLDFLTDNNLGSFGISAPAIAMNTFKKRFMKHEIFLHDRRKVLALERDCYYGGLVNCFYIGKSKGETLYHTDVNSLYPSVMLERFPTKMIREENFPSVQSLISKSTALAWAATVMINSKKNTYSVRYNGRLCECNGRFKTSLCGPELQRAIANGDVSSVLYAAQYETEYIFEDYVNYFWAMRQKHKEPKGNPTEQLVKLLMNSLYGKFGMKGYDYVDYSRSVLESLYNISCVPFPEQYDNNSFMPNVEGHTTQWHADGLPDPLHLRYINGKLEIKYPSGEHSESFCAIAAFVTSYARERLRQLIWLAGERNTYYCDTDSLFVNGRGYNNLIQAREIDTNTLGKLKLESSNNVWEFFGPKDYRFGTKDVMKGIRSNAKKVGPNTFQQLQFEGLKSVMKRGGENYIDITTICKTVKRVYNKGLITSSGWTLPFTLQQ